MSNDFQTGTEESIFRGQPTQESDDIAETNDNTEAKILTAYDSEEDEDDEILPEGGAGTYEDFKIVHKFTDADDDEYHDFDDLQKNVKIEHIPGISARLERQQDASSGRVYVRVIFDHKTAVYLHRKDDGDTTHLKISLGYNVS